MEHSTTAPRHSTRDKALLIFDGDCGFCTASATWIQSRWKEGAAETVAWQVLGKEGLRECGLTPKDAKRQAWWVATDGTVYGAEAAIGQALMRAGGLLGVMGRIAGARALRWPMHWGYVLVARYRYKLPGSTPACRL